MQCSNYLVSQLPNRVIRDRTRMSVGTDRLRHFRAKVMKLYIIGNRKCLHFISLILMQRNSMA